MPEVFAAGGIKFDFSADYVSEVLSVVQQEYERLG